MPLSRETIGLTSQFAFRPGAVPSDGSAQVLQVSGAILALAPALGWKIHHQFPNWPHRVPRLSRGHPTFDLGTR